VTREGNKATTGQTPSGTLEQVGKFLAQDGADYTLRMYWLGRADKIRSDELPVLEWLTRNCLPKHLANSFVGFQPGMVCFMGEDNHEMARTAMAAAASAVAGRAQGE